jgi:hypothetical protein
MGANISREAGETLMKIVQGADSLQSMVQSTAAATEKMSSISEHDSNGVQGIAHCYRRDINCSEQICPSLFQHHKARG